MGKNDATTRLIDEVIRFGVGTLGVSTVLVAPNLVVALDKPMQKLFAHLDARERERKLRAALRYMRAQGYLAGDYEHGLQLSKKARQRLARIDAKTIHTAIPAKWDGYWRIVLYDIPEKHLYARRQFSSAMRSLGSIPLQKSAWIYPFPCRDEIAQIAARLEIDTFITYFEATYLDNRGAMLAIFTQKYPQVIF